MDQLYWMIAVSLFVLVSGIFLRIQHFEILTVFNLLLIFIVALIPVVNIVTWICWFVDFLASPNGMKLNKVIYRRKYD